MILFFATLFDVIFMTIVLTIGLINLINSLIY